MTFKINIGDKSGKTYKIEVDEEKLVDKELHAKIKGEEISPELKGYEFEIAGATDNAGFMATKEVPGIGLKKVLLSYGKGMHKRSKKEGKKRRSNPKPKGLRLRKTMRGRIISPAIVQINLKILKQGSKQLSEIFLDQNQKAEPEKLEEKK